VTWQALRESSISATVWNFYGADESERFVLEDASQLIKVVGFVAGPQLQRSRYVQRARLGIEPITRRAPTSGGEPARCYLLSIGKA